MKPILSYFLAAFVVLVTGCATLPPPKDRLETAALTVTAGTQLGRAIAPGVAPNPGKTGIHALPDSLNTMGLDCTIASSTRIRTSRCASATRFLDVDVPMLAYEVRVAADSNNLEWTERTASGEKHYDTGPEADWSTRRGVELPSILPIEWLLLAAPPHLGHRKERNP